MTVITIIMLVSVVLLLVGAIVRSVDWKGIAIRWVGYNPSRAQVYIKAGNHVRTVEGKRDKDNDLIYHYKIDKKEKTLIVTANYPHEDIRGRRIIGICDGVVVPSPLGFMSAEEIKHFKETEQEVSAVLHSALITKMLKSLSSGKALNWLMVVIVLGGLAVGYMLFKDKINPPAVSGNYTEQVQPGTGQNIIVVTPPPQKVTP